MSAIVVRATGPARIDAWRDDMSVAHALKVYGRDTWIVRRGDEAGRVEWIEGELAARTRLWQLADATQAAT